MEHASGYKRYALVGLTLVYTLSMSDQGLIALLLQPIKESLRLTDTQLGFLTGMAFALFYAVAGVPFARWADRGNRVTITSTAIALWGLAVMACVFVSSFIQLVAARVVTSIGGAGCMSPTYSLVGDYFPEPAERTRAMTVYTAANALSLSMSFIVGGWLNEKYGWRFAFAALGVPALLVAIVVKLTLDEPRTSIRLVAERQPGDLGGLRSLWIQRSSRHLSVALIVLFTMAFGLAPWYAAFMMRSHGMRTAELGLWLGLVLGVGGVAGTLVGGFVADRWFVGNERGQMRFIAVALAVFVPFLAIFLFSARKTAALIAFVPCTVLLNVFFGPTYAILQRLVVDEVRATTLAVLMLICNLIGMGLGPQVVGVLSDFMMPRFGGDSLRYAMLITSMMAMWAAYHFWQVGGEVREDLSTVDGLNRDATTRRDSRGAVPCDAPPGTDRCAQVR